MTLFFFIGTGTLLVAGIACTFLDNYAPIVWAIWGASLIISDAIKEGSDR